MYTGKCGCTKRVVCTFCIVNGMGLHGFRSLLSKAERRNYIEAIQCIHSKPALTPAAISSGARSRYDDFVVTHVQQTYAVHGTVRLPKTSCPSPQTSRTKSNLDNKVCIADLNLGQFSDMAPLLHLGLRATFAQRMRIQGLPTV
jgi:hypothetical protein